MKYLILPVLVCSMGCATILQPGPDKVMVNSKPDGAKVLLDGQLVGRTPVMVEIPRNSDGNFRLELEGYESITIQRDKVMSGSILVNILLGGVIGVTVDLVTHNQGHYQSEPIYKDLNPVVPIKQAQN